MSTTERFSDRVKYYIKSRPGYPQAILAVLEEHCGLTPDFEVADIGAGVGHSARLFTDYGCYVYGIEPNQAMFDQLIREMQLVPNFSARLKTASNTDLDDSSIDLVIAGQAFHWFDHRAAKTEFRRIGKDNVCVVLMWNEWQEDTAFGKAYTELVKTYSVDYEQVSRTADTTQKAIDYLYDSYQQVSFEHSQQFDLDMLKARYLSSSYSLLPTMDGHEAAMTALRELFEQYQTNGTIEFAYTCNVYYGRL